MATSQPPTYTKQLMTMVTPEVGGEIAAWAQLLGRSQSQIGRELIEAGLEALRTTYETEAPRKMTQKLLRQHIERVREQGRGQVDRRRTYDQTWRSKRVETESADPGTD